jgi:hypothetical protein
MRAGRADSFLRRIPWLFRPAERQIRGPEKPRNPTLDRRRLSAFSPWREARAAQVAPTDAPSVLIRDRPEPGLMRVGVEPRSFRLSSRSVTGRNRPQAVPPLLRSAPSTIDL